MFIPQNIDTMNLELDLLSEKAAIQTIQESIGRQQRFVNELTKSVQSRCPHLNYKIDYYDEWSGQWWQCTVCGILKQGNREDGGRGGKPPQSNF